ncbi:hypothetical protein PJM35_0003 [Salmonella phage vB_SenS_UTK0007]|uniref:Uncharacterized protein n=2 Tax=Tlsvirus TaxID=1920865 RepID=A0AAE9ZHI3_9CAUD|nr:hypothetical protein HOS51_gp84 [Salmonella phage YSP2]ATW57843.1 hypothetical protein YSP2_101 [Salmonella phage YSP2]WDR21581.1 hypothetical protein PJM35_0003 [Salmonella phage vB_SenS_UTK0007]
MLCKIRFHGNNELKAYRIIASVIIGRLYLRCGGSMVKLKYRPGRVINSNTGRWIQNDELLWHNAKGRLYIKTLEDLRE